jgi:hypothetical protein
MLVVWLGLPLAILAVGLLLLIPGEPPAKSRL